MAENASMDQDEKYGNLEKQLGSLQIEKQKIQDEYGIQRAKMKDLFVQKENEFKQQLVDQEEKYKQEIKKLQSELDDCQSQLTVSSLQLQSTKQEAEAETRKYREELFSLQHLLNETIEEASHYANEIKHLKHLNLKLETELKNSSNSGGDMPQILSVPGTVISSLARKVTNQITTQLSNSDSGSGAGTMATLSQLSDSDTLDDSMRKAQEDAAVLRSLVVPLEEEIKALKDKLREMDAELRRYQRADTNSLMEDEGKSVRVAKMIDLDSDESVADGSSLSITGNLNQSAEKQSSSLSWSSPTTTNAVTKDCLIENSSVPEKKPGTSAGCEMCSNYEAQLVNAQQKILDLEKHIITLERYKQELSKETAFRKDMEEKWNEKKEEYKEEVKALQSKTEKSEETLKMLKAEFSNAYLEVTQRVERLCEDRENNQRELNRLQRENNNLVGKFNKHSQQLQSEVINLPNNVEDLQELILRTQEELIAAKIAEERANELVASLSEEVAILRDQSQSQEQARIHLENTLTESMNKLRSTVAAVSAAKNSNAEVHHENAVDFGQELIQFSSDIDRLAESKKHFERMVNELRSRVTSLQNDLDNSEKVQKDFVLLSQSLQQELEKIRGAETEVRWEHDEDVIECRRCKQPFSVTRRKTHCKHCGRIFCSSCLTCTVNSGPNNRPSKVCDVCHTLLVRDSAPYFSTVPPQGD